MVIPVPNYDDTRKIFSCAACGCDCGNRYYNDNIRRDCHWYHCEHQMGASIDCCTLRDSLGDCPCSEDCENYISNNEINNVVADYIRNRRC